MEIWAIANQKGGVGKTTTTISVADALANRGYRVLLLDLDPQASLTSYLKLDPDQIENTTYDLFEQPARIKPRETGFDRLHIVGGSLGLANLEKRAATIQGKGLVLKSWLSTKIDLYDFCLVDTPPALGMLMINALVACDRLLVPVQTDFLALKGLERMLRMLVMLGRSGREINYLLIPTMYDQRTNASKRTLQTLRNQYSDHLWSGIIPVDTRLRDASRLGVPPSTMFSQSRAVSAYDNLTADLLGELGERRA
jgi:chromosome partitioning protein